MIWTSDEIKTQKLLIRNPNFPFLFISQDKRLAQNPSPLAPFRVLRMQLYLKEERICENRSKCWRC